MQQEEVHLPNGPLSGAGIQSRSRQFDGRSPSPSLHSPQGRQRLVELSEILLWNPNHQDQYPEGDILLHSGHSNLKIDTPRLTIRHPLWPIPEIDDVLYKNN
jgi:hypothetical protein